MVSRSFRPFFDSILLLLLFCSSFIISSSDGHYQRQQFPSYPSYGSEMDDRHRKGSENDARRQQQQKIRGNRRFTSATDLYMMVFEEDGFDECWELCEVNCVPVLSRKHKDKPLAEQGTLWLCNKLRPPPEPFHEKIFSHLNNASPLDYVIFAVVLFAVLSCLVFGCYKCCCRQNSRERRNSSRSFAEERHTNRNSTNFANHFDASTKANHLGSSGHSAERESLTNGGTTQMSNDSLIHPTPLSSGKNGETSLPFGRPPLPQQSPHAFDQSAI